MGFRLPGQGAPLCGPRQDQVQQEPTMSLGCPGIGTCAAFDHIMGSLTACGTSDLHVMCRVD